MKCSGNLRLLLLLSHTYYDVDVLSSPLFHNIMKCGSEFCCIAFKDTDISTNSRGDMVALKDDIL